MKTAVAGDIIHHDGLLADGETLLTPEPIAQPTRGMVSMTYCKKHRPKPKFARCHHLPHHGTSDYYSQPPDTDQAYDTMNTPREHICMTKKDAAAVRKKHAKSMNQLKKSISRKWNGFNWIPVAPVSTIPDRSEGVAQQPAFRGETETSNSGAEEESEETTGLTGILVEQEGAEASEATIPALAKDEQHAEDTVSVIQEDEQSDGEKAVSQKCPSEVGCNRCIRRASPKQQNGQPAAETVSLLEQGELELTKDSKSLLDPSEDVAEQIRVRNVEPLEVVDIEPSRPSSYISGRSASSSVLTTASNTSGPPALQDVMEPFTVTMPMIEQEDVDSKWEATRRPSTKSSSSPDTQPGQSDLDLIFVSGNPLRRNFKVYRAEDDIQPGTTVATIWPYRSHASDEFDLDRGDTLEVVQIWSDGWASGFLVEEQTSIRDVKRNVPYHGTVPSLDFVTDDPTGEQDEEIEGGSLGVSRRRCKARAARGEIKTFPLVAVCRSDLLEQSRMQEPLVVLNDSRPSQVTLNLPPTSTVAKHVRFPGAHQPLTTSTKIISRSVSDLRSPWGEKVAGTPSFSYSRTIDLWAKGGEKPLYSSSRTYHSTIERRSTAKIAARHPCTRVDC